jgi:hypothetical protein
LLQAVRQDSPQREWRIECSRGNTADGEQGESYDERSNTEEERRTQRKSGSALVAAALRRAGNSRDRLGMTAGTTAEAKAGTKAARSPRAGSARVVIVAGEEVAAAEPAGCDLHRRARNCRQWRRGQPRARARDRRAGTRMGISRGVAPAPPINSGASNERIGVRCEDQADYLSVL